MSVTKAEIAANLSRDLGIQLSHARELVDDFFEECRELLETNHDIKLSGFGNFILRDKVARPGRNPRTGEEVTIAPRRVVTFKAGQKLKQQVQSS